MNLKEVIIFAGLRIADMISTYLAMRKYGGWDTIEAIPFNAMLIHRFGFFSLVIVNSVISAIFILLLLFLNRVWITRVVLAIMFLVVLNNLLIFLLI